MIHKGKRTPIKGHSESNLVSSGVNMESGSHKINLQSLLENGGQECYEFIQYLYANW